VRRSLLRSVWALIFLLVLLVPLVLCLLVDDRSHVFDEMSVTFGLLAASVLVCAAVLPSRLRSLTQSFGIERVLKTHRYLGLLALVLVLLHAVLVFVANPHNLALLDVRHAPNRARAAVGATGGLLVLSLLAVVRKRVHRRYEMWRWMHVTFAVLVLVLSALHVWWLNHLVRDPLMRACFVIMAAGLLVLLAIRWVWRPIIAHRRAFVVREVRAESPSVSTVVLQPRSRRRRVALQFSPGQFAWLRLHRSSFVRGEHPFTIASGSHTRGLTEFTIRHVGDFTSSISKLRPGRTVYVDGPHGSFSVDQIASTGLVLIAGGVGITPMMSMLRTLAHRGDRRPHRLIIAARHVEELLFIDELAELQRDLELAVVPVVSQPSPEWSGKRGRINAELLADVLPGQFRRNQLDYFICGSPPMVGGVLEALRDLGVPEPRIHTEQFDMV
jgi:predicted ferric reductase